MTWVWTQIGPSPLGVHSKPHLNATTERRTELPRTPRDWRFLMWLFGRGTENGERSWSITVSNGSFTRFLNNRCSSYRLNRAWILLIDHLFCSRSCPPTQNLNSHLTTKRLLRMSWQKKVSVRKLWTLAELQKRRLLCTSLTSGFYLLLVFSISAHVNTLYPGFSWHSYHV